MTTPSIAARVTIVHSAITALLRETDSDSAIQFCKDNNLPLVGHVLGDALESPTTTTSTSTNTSSTQAPRANATQPPQTT